MSLSFEIKKLFSSPERALMSFLGLFWFIDGILQLQPAMFSDQFITAVLSPNLPNQPAIVASFVSFGINIFTINPVLMNSFFAFIQLLIGIFLLSSSFMRWQKVLLWVSITWSLIVWVFGEGLGGLFTGLTTLYIGAPGSVLLYLLLAKFLIYPKKFPVLLWPRILGILFILGAILNCLPVFWTKDTQSMAYVMSQSDSISFIAWPANALSHIILSPFINNLFEVSILLILGVWLLMRPTRLIGTITLVFLFFVWWISQDFGGIFTFPNGTATDIGSAPLFMLFLIPLFFTKNIPND